MTETVSTDPQKVSRHSLPVSTLGRWLGLDPGYLVSSTFWTSSEKVIRITGELAIIALLTRLTTSAILGQYVLLMSVYTVAATLSTTGLNAVLLRALAQGHDGTLRLIIQLTWRWTIIAALVLTGSSIILRPLLPAFIGPGLLVAALLLPGQTIYRKWEIIAQAKERFRLRTTYHAITMALLLIVVPVVAAGSRNSAITIFAANFGIQGALSYFFYLNMHRLITPRATIHAGWKKSGYRLFLADLFSIAYAHLDKILVASWLGVETLAIYAIATKLGEGIKLFSGNVVSAYIPRIYRHGISSALKWLRARRFSLLFGSIAMMTPLWLLTPWLIQILFGDQYTASITYAQWYTLVVPLHLFASLGGQLLICARQELAYVYATTAAGIANILLYALLIPIWGIAGAVAGSIGYYSIAVALYYTATVRKHHKVQSLGTA